MQTQCTDKTKQQIRRCFNKAAHTYDRHNAVQEQVARQLLSLLSRHKLTPQKIIDLGCGSGSVTELLAHQFPFKLFHALDISDQLLFKARARLRGYRIHIYEGDFDYANTHNELFDLAFSNMALQWSVDLNQAIAMVRESLVDGVILAFSLPLEGTFAELNQFAKNNFYSAKAVINRLAKNGFEIVEHYIEPFSFSFDSLYIALKTLKAVGANYVFDKPNKSLRGKAFLHDLTRHAKNFVFTYQTGFFIARKVVHVA